MNSKVKLASYHQFLGHAHIQNYNINTKINEFDQLDGVFDKNKSVFKDWKMDKAKTIQDGLIDEIQYWNVPNFVKDEDEVDKITKFLKEEAEFLKTLFIIKSA